MTVSYQYKVTSSTSGGFLRLLFLWRGSLYKLIYRELLIFLLLFDLLSILYRKLLIPEHQLIFEKLVTYCDTFISLIPLTFILGFYVAYVATRWWQQYEAIPWPDKTMHTIALYVPGNDERTRVMRRSLMRYLNLTLVLILRSISSAVKKRFPSIDHLVDLGFMTQAEKQLFLSVPNNEFNTYWIPCTWFIHVLRDVRAEHPKIDSQGIKLIMEEFNEFRAKCGTLWSYDWISIPLVYTQVVTLATYSFFGAALIGRQYVEHNSDRKMQMKIDIYIPVFTILQFFFFMGLLKVAEQLINPFGDDDEDFELNWLIDRHTKVSYLGVDSLMLQRPPLVKDIYFDVADLELPYTSASAVYKKKTFRGSVHFMHVPANEQEMYLPEITEEDAESPRTRRSSSFFSRILQGAPPANDVLAPTDRYSPHMSEFNLENGVYKYKKSSLDGNENLRRANVASTPNSTPKTVDCPLSRISVLPATDATASDESGRKKVTKTNSMSSAAARRKSTVFLPIVYQRRKSAPTAVLRRQPSSATLTRNVVRWPAGGPTARRESITPTNTKGIRWKPFLKTETRGDDVMGSNSLIGASALAMNSRDGGGHLTSDHCYENRAFDEARLDEVCSTRTATTTEAIVHQVENDDDDDDEAKNGSDTSTVSINNDKRSKFTSDTHT